MVQKNPQNKNIQNEFQNIKAEMKGQFVERDEQITGTLCAILSGKHLVMFGPPGTAKSLLTREICARIEGSNLFERLLTKFTTPEEIFGPISLKALENDSFQRVTAGKLPECEIAFLDETFKANSAILNSLLTIINERLYHNDGQIMNVPLISLFGASNELPESAELNALYDRFLLRYMVNYIGGDSSFIDMLKGSAAGQKTTITLKELMQAQAEVQAVQVPDEIFESLAHIRTGLKNEGIIPSDRRFRATLPVLQAHAWLRGVSSVSVMDLKLLEHMLWDNPDQIKTVKKVILATSNPLLQKITEYIEEAEDVYSKALEAVKKEPSKGSAIGVEVNGKLKPILTEMEKLVKQAKAEGRPADLIEEGKAKVEEINKEALKKFLGV